MAFGNQRKRTIVIALSGVIVLSLSAAFADNLLPQDSIVEAPTAPIDETQTVVDSVAETATVVLAPESQTAAETIGNSQIATPAPVAKKSAPTPDETFTAVAETTTVPILINPQPNLTLRMPLSIGVDPRSRSYLMSSIEFRGALIYLACFTGASVVFDIGTTGVLDNFAGDNFIVEGDRTSKLLVSGSGAAIKALLQSSGGMRITSSSGALSGHALTLSLTALNRASTKSEYCGAAKAASTSVFSPLKIDLGITKGQGTLK